ncbi:hypothetical protein, partial [Streptomyces sporangiiformans]|uniref:hypothetical protein n=1 Tax=Streptomyces sporangiiformans TaxID=2315329 RepID=UPI0019699247
MPDSTPSGPSSRNQGFLRHARQHTVRAQLQEHTDALILQPAHTLTETHRRTDMTHPVLRRRHIR